MEGKAGYQGMLVDNPAKTQVHVVSDAEYKSSAHFYGSEGQKIASKDNNIKFLGFNMNAPDEAVKKEFQSKIVVP